MEEELQSTSSQLKKQYKQEAQICQIDIANRSKCRWLFVIGYLGIFYFVIMAIVYILIEYALIKKYQSSLQCNQSTLTCEGKIDNIYTQNLIYFQLASDYATSKFNYQVNIDAILLWNSTNTYSLELIEDVQTNAYLYYRHFWAIASLNLIYSYNITVKFTDKIPPPFMTSLTAILRESGMFDQDQTINQAILCLVFAAFVSIFNILNKIMETQNKMKFIKEQQREIRKIYYQIPQDIGQIDDKLDYIREIALQRLTKSQKRLTTESDSEYSSLTN